MKNTNFYYLFTAATSCGEFTISIVSPMNESRSLQLVYDIADRK